MTQGNTLLSRLFQVLILIGLAALLSACAGRPKQLEPSRPFTITEVRVAAESVEDVGFAGRLQQRLEATVGRPTSDIGHTATLRIVVLNQRTTAGPVGFLNTSAQTASLHIAVIDAATGQLLRSQALGVTATGQDREGARTILVDRLVNDIRALLGLSGTTPYPVSGVKRAVVRPLEKPEPLSDAALLSADPLLNGSVTATTPDLDPQSEAAPAMDISRPLLDASPEPGEPEPDGEPSAEVEVTVPQGLQLPAEAPEIGTVAAPAPESGTGDEPCVITLDNDCSDPDSR